MNAQTLLAGLAMIFVGAMGLLMIWHSVPPANHDFLVFILGALSGALTVGGANKIADRVTNTQGGDATINAADLPK